MITSLVKAGGIQTGTEAKSILERYFLKALEAKGSEQVVIPAAYWRVQAMPAEYVQPGEDELIVLQGVVLVRVLGRLQMTDDLSRR